MTSSSGLSWEALRTQSLWASHHRLFGGQQARISDGGVVYSEPSSRFIFFPYDTWYRCWWYFTTVCAVITAIFTPWEIAFQDKPGLRPYNDAPAILEFLLSTIFLIDIIISFNLAFPRSDGLYETRRRVIGWNYFRKLFFLDLIGIVPFATIFVEALDEDQEKTRLVALLRLTRLVRVRRVWSFFRDFETNIRLPLVIVTLFRNLTIVILAAHFAGCGFYFIARRYGFDNDTWIGQDMEFLKNLSEWEKYVYTLYWSITTMTTVGYGDYSPKNTAEVIFATGYMLFNIALNSYILGTITLIVIKADEKTGEQRNSYNKLAKFAMANSLGNDMRKALKEHMRFNFAHPEVQDDSVLNGLPAGVKRKVMRQLYGKKLQESEVFSGVSPTFINALLDDIRVDVYMPAQEIMAFGDCVRELHLLLGGVASKLAKPPGRHNAHAALEEEHEFHEGDMFSVDGFVTNLPVSYAVHTKSICRVLVISQEVFERACERFPKDGENVYKAANFRRQMLGPWSSVTNINTKHPSDFPRRGNGTKLQNILKNDSAPDHISDPSSESSPCKTSTQSQKNSPPDPKDQAVIQMNALDSVNDPSGRLPGAVDNER